MTIGIAAAGTGGHVYPALAIAEALVGLGADRSDIVFFGGDRLEATAVPEAGFELVPIKVRGLVRSLSPQNLKVLAAVRAGARTVRSHIAARDIGVMLAMGGYITGPAALAARRAGIPLFLHEQNAVPGLANRMAARLAQRVFVAFPGPAARLPRSEVVGNPLRAALLGDIPGRDEARARYGLDLARPVLGVLGGSQGADALNRVAPRLAGANAGYQILHLAGAGQHEAWTERAGDHKDWVVVPFEREMQYFYGAVDGVVARAGALTVSELAATGTPSILVPYPGAAGHQEANARFLADAGGAQLLMQAELGRLETLVVEMLAPSENARRAAAASAVGRPNAAVRVAAAVKEAANA